MKMGTDHFETRKQPPNKGRGKGEDKSSCFWDLGTDWKGDLSKRK